MQSLDDFQVSNRVKQNMERRLVAQESSDTNPVDVIKDETNGLEGDIINYTHTNNGIRRDKATKEKIVILGTGWGAHAFLKTIDATKYDVTVISPRNYFMFTPMLAASAVGTVELRSICEPIRNVNPLVDYLEATVRCDLCSIGM